jgi:hypothetical protein
MKKKLNTEAITNELKQGSVFFRQRPALPLQASEPEANKEDQKLEEQREAANNKALSQGGEKENHSNRLTPTTAPKKKVAHSKPSPAKARQSPPPNVRAERPERVERPPSPTPAELGNKREIKRHSFEFYRDQLPKLKRLKAEFMIRGEDKSMSAMVREAHIP